MSSDKQRLDEIKRDIMIIRQIQEATDLNQIYRALEKIVFLLKRERKAIKEGQHVYTPR